MPKELCSNLIIYWIFILPSPEETQSIPSRKTLHWFEFSFNSVWCISLRGAQRAFWLNSSLFVWSRAWHKQWGSLPFPSLQKGFKVLTCLRFYTSSDTKWFGISGFIRAGVLFAICANAVRCWQTKGLFWLNGFKSLLRAMQRKNAESAWTPKGTWSNELCHSRLLVSCLQIFPNYLEKKSKQKKNRPRGY